MWKKGSVRCIRGCFFTVFLFAINTINAQETLSYNRKKGPRTPMRSGVQSQAKDTSIARQPLFAVLKQLNITKGIYFLFSDKTFGQLMVNPVVNLNRPVEHILEEILQFTGLKYKKVNDKTFVIVSSIAGSDESGKTNKPVAAEEIKPPHIAPKVAHIVKGKITNSEGKPLPNVTVIVKGSSHGTTTNSNGDFDLPGITGDVLQLSCVGYERKEVHLNTTNAVIYVNTHLNVIENVMNEVVVTALGVNKYTRSLGYSLSAVSSEDLTQSGNTNFASSLYGRSPGVLISTAPGGATSAVQVLIRGVNSLNFNAQPLYVVDGIVIRNTNEKGITGINNGGYWIDARIRGNGILDINPADIDNLTILKGASATALYGSEAAAGVVVITTKKGTPKKRLGVTVNYTNTIEQAAFLPKYQDKYGPGGDRATNLSEGANEDGWIPVDTDGDGVNDRLRPNFTAWSQFGPKFDGQMVPWWDGQMRSYTAHKNNYKDLYRTGINSIFNTAVANQTDRIAYRLSYTRNDYKGIQQGGNLQRNTFHLNSNIKITDKLNVDVISNYFNSKVHNRPIQLSRVTAAYSGFINRAEDAGVFFDKYKTRDGYKWVPPGEAQRNPAEALRYDTKHELLDFLWMQLRNSEDEYEDRLLNSLTLNYEFNKEIKFRVRLGNDFTSLKTETLQYNEYPVMYNGNLSTGLYGSSEGRYSILYGDGLLTWAKKLNRNWNLSVTGGFQSRKEQYNDQHSETAGGLVKENWFSLENSLNPIVTTLNRSSVLKYAFLGYFNLAYKNFLFLEGTTRQEYSSTLPPGRNNYFYPSFNTGFVFTDAFHLPAWFSFGKLRASYGIVGNAPPPYASAVTYNQTRLTTINNAAVTALNTQMNAGNNEIRPENKFEGEVGLETMLFKNRLGVDVTWYNSLTVDQILQLSIPASSGANSKLVNAGELQSNGLEVGISALPLSGKKFKWNTRLNFSMSRSKVSKLAPGVKNIVFFETEQNAIRVVADEGETVGNIYVNPRLTNRSGQYVIGSNGLYVIDNSRYQKAGNVMPRATGGWFNSLSWKRFTLDCAIDFRFGGKLVSPPVKYNLGAGMYKSTLKYRDAENGGLPYYINNVGEKVLLPNHDAAAPNGSKVYHDGVILEGVTTTGKENSQIIDAAYYYMNTFYWGASALNESAVLDNSYIKMREIVLGYSLPQKITSKLHFNSIRFSLIGRNLFYFWRTLKNLDPEATIGSTWIRQSVDEGSMAATRSFGFSINLDF